MHNTYLAAKYSRREEMEALVPFFNKLGYDIIARWVFGNEEGLSAQDVCDLDLDDVKSSDMVIVFTHERKTPQPGGGRFVEMGYAMALNKKMIIIGPIENVFCADNSISRYETLEDFKENHEH